MSNWGKLSSMSGSLYFSEESLNLIENDFNNTKAKDLETGYLDKYFSYNQSNLIENKVFPGYEYLFFTGTQTNYDYSLDSWNAQNKTYYDYNLYGGNAIDNSLNLTKLGSIENSTTWLNVYSDISDSSGTYLVGSIDSEKKVKKYDITTGASSDATNISNNLQNLFANAEGLYFPSSIFFESSKFGNLSVVSFIEEGSDKYQKSLVSYINASSGAEILHTFSDQHDGVNLHNALEDDNGTITFITDDWGDYDQETKTAIETTYINTLDQTGSITQQKIATHDFYSFLPEHGYLGYSNFSYFLWSDDSGDEWLLQKEYKNLTINPKYNPYASGKYSQFSQSLFNYKGWLLDTFTSIDQKADVTASYLENNDIEDKYNGSTFVYESPQKGEIILAVVGAEASDISYFSNFFEGVTVAINEANDFDAYRYLATNTHLIDVFGADTAQAQNHYNLYAKQEKNTLMKFDEWLYMASNLDILQVFNGDGNAAIKHYVEAGYKEGRAKDTFDASNYLASNSDLILYLGLDNSKAAQHYSINGFTEGRSLDSFDEWSYLATHDDLISAISDVNLADNHFTQNGFFEGREKDAFDELSYIASHDDLISAFGSNSSISAKHFVQSGFAEGREKDTFDEWSYMASNLDLITAFGSNSTAGIQHFIQAGFSEGRTKDSFNEWSYMASNVDLITAFGSNTSSAVQHFVQSGFAEGRETDSFDKWGYLASNTDLIDVFGSKVLEATAHYVVNGYSEGKVTNGFNASNYLSNYSDLQAIYGNNTDLAKIHFVQLGYSEGRTDSIK